MNEAFRNYAFGRAFNLHLSERHSNMLAQLAKGDVIASLGLDSSAKHGLLRRGLIEFYLDHEKRSTRVRLTRAGMLVYDLLVEAGEFAALQERRRIALEKETELLRIEAEERVGRIEIRLKDRFRRDPENVTE